jgi:UDP-N-acetylglucosamine transferase subunit ALG13
MIRVFATVGTTRFDSLIRAVDSLDATEYELSAQIADGLYEPSTVQFFRFSSHIVDEYTNADIVITHAGAGTVYELLELSKPLLIVPNLERRDHHQLDLYHYMVSEGFAFGSRTPDALDERLRDAVSRLGSLRPYVHRAFDDWNGLLGAIGLPCDIAVD